VIVVCLLCIPETVELSPSQLVAQNPTDPDCPISLQPGSPIPSRNAGSSMLWC